MTKENKQDKLYIRLKKILWHTTSINFGTQFFLCANRLTCGGITRRHWRKEIVHIPWLAKVESHCVERSLSCLRSDCDASSCRFAHSTGFVSISEEKQNRHTCILTHYNRHYPSTYLNPALHAEVPHTSLFPVQSLATSKKSMWWRVAGFCEEFIVIRSWHGHLECSILALPETLAPFLECSFIVFLCVTANWPWSFLESLIYDDIGQINCHFLHIPNL